MSTERARRSKNQQAPDWGDHSEVVAKMDGGDRIRIGGFQVCPEHLKLFREMTLRRRAKQEGKPTYPDSISDCKPVGQSRWVINVTLSIQLDSTQMNRLASILKTKNQAEIYDVVPASTARVLTVTLRGSNRYTDPNMRRDTRADLPNLVHEAIQELKRR